MFESWDAHSRGRELELRALRRPPMRESTRASTSHSADVFQRAWKFTRQDRALSLPKELLSAAHCDQLIARLADKQEIYVPDTHRLLKSVSTDTSDSFCDESLNWLLYSAQGLETFPDRLPRVVDTLKRLPRRAWLQEWSVARKRCLNVVADVEKVAGVSIAADRARDLLVAAVEAFVQIAVIGEDMEWLGGIVASLLATALGRLALSQVLLATANESPAPAESAWSVVRVDSLEGLPPFSFTLRNLMACENDTDRAMALQRSAGLGFEIAGLVFRTVDFQERWDVVLHEIFAGRTRLYQREHVTVPPQVALERNGLRIHASPLVHPEWFIEEGPRLPLQLTAAISR